MLILLRKNTVDEQGNHQLTDYELESDVITLGSAPDSDIQLLGKKIVALHAKIRNSDKGLEIQASKHHDFEHNGARVKQAQLTLNDELRVGRHRLTLIAPPPGFDVALQWVPADVDGGLLANAYQTRLSQTEFRARPIAWMLTLSILLLAGLLPLADYLIRTQLFQTEQAVAIQAETSQRYRADSFWTSGPLHSAHRVAIGNQCEVCHQKPFQQVRDQACTDCHTETALHVQKNHQHAALFAEQVCQDCHKEHNEPAQLTNRNDALCVGCHLDLESNQSVANVSGFGDGAHPPFKLSMLVPEVIASIGSVSVEWRSQRQIPSSDLTDAVGTQMLENSHLKFPHDVHLDVTKVRHQSADTPLQCSDCHSLSADQEHFADITMEQHCADCHALSFDPENPKKQLPHGDVAAVYPALEAHFLAQAFNPPTEAERVRRRLPAKTDKSSACREDFNCAKKLAEAENDRQFSQKGCVTCHQVEQIADVDPQSRWQLLPVQLNGDWFPAAQFNHRSHLTQRGNSGNAVCESCHRASDANSAQVVLIPGIDNCTQCHSDATHQDKVVLECVSCHAYHPAPLLRQRRALFSAGTLPTDTGGALP